MNTEIKNRWVKALRSGEYEQGKDRLCSMDKKFCCLGVLVDLYVKETGATWAIQEDDSGVDCYSMGCNWGSLPDEVIDWSGLADQDPQVRELDSGRTLSALNDSFDRSFEEIAVLIENQL